MLIAFARCANSGDKWILGSIASFHICINRDFIRMGDLGCQIAGIVSVQLMMHDGIMRILTNVRHITFTTWVRIIFLSVNLMIKGTSMYYIGHGVLKVSNGSLIVMKCDLKSFNMYSIHGTKITSSAVLILIHYLILMLLI
jgi:hypothetical protein